MSNREPVLIIEDDIDIREALRDLILSESYAAVDVGDGQAGLAYLRSHPLPPLILLDWNMSPMNGPQFMAELQKDPALSSVPVVLLTADTRSAEKAAGSNFAGRLEKPIDLDALFAMLKRYCA